MEKLLLAAIVIISILAFNNSNLILKYSFKPSAIKQGQWYRFISHIFLHSDYMHLFFNGFVYYSFSGYVLKWLQLVAGEQAGLVLFLGLFMGGAVAGVIPAYFRERNNPYYTAVGASGGVSALVFAMVLINPTSTLLVFFIPMKAYLFGVLYLAYEFYMAKKHKGDKIAHDVHFVAALFGLVYIFVVYPPVLRNFIESVF